MCLYGTSSGSPTVSNNPHTKHSSAPSSGGSRSTKVSHLPETEQNLDSSSNKSCSHCTKCQCKLKPAKKFDDIHTPEGVIKVTIETMCSHGNLYNCWPSCNPNLRQIHTVNTCVIAGVSKDYSLLQGLNPFKT